MKAKIPAFVMLLLISGSGWSQVSGCAGPKVHVSYGYQWPYCAKSPRIFEVYPAGSFTITLQSCDHHHTEFYLSELYRNDSLILKHNWSEDKINKIVLPDIPGRYRVSAIDIMHYICYWNFDLKFLPPLGADTTRSNEPNSLIETAPSAPAWQITIHPDLVHDMLRVTVEADLLSAISILDYTGKVVRSVEVGGKSVDVPLTDMQAGVYLVNVTTKGGHLERRRYILGVE